MLQMDGCEEGWKEEGEGDREEIQCQCINFALSILQ